MIPAEFDYVAPRTVNEVLSLLADRPDAKLLAGGHSLIPLMKLRLAEPALLIDLRHLDSLRGIRVEGGRLVVGALTPHAEIAASQNVMRQTPALAQAAGTIGDRQVRARGTIGGSLAHADPAADFPAVMLALGADIVARSRRGERMIASDDYFRGLMETALAPDELITEVRLPATPRSAYVKFANPASHYAIVGVAAGLRGNGMVSGARIGVTGAAPFAYRASQAEAFLQGKPLTPETIEAAANVAPAGHDMMGDIHASEEYRAALVRVMTSRALKSLA